MNTHIDFETSKLLKEKGFNEPCKAIWQKNKKISYCDNNTTITNFFIYPDPETLALHIKEYPKNVSLINGIYFLNSCYNFTAPTIAEVVMWLYEKHGIWIGVNSSTVGKFWLYMWKKGKTCSPDYKSDIHNAEFNSPSEAYQEAISYTLKNLIK